MLPGYWNNGRLLTAVGRAVRNELGWSVNGPLNGNSGATEVKLPSITVNRISVHKLEEMLTAQNNYDFNNGKMEDEQM